MPKILIILFLIFNLAGLTENTELGDTFEAINGDQDVTDFLSTFEEVFKTPLKASFDPSEPNICRKEECKKLAENMERNMNTSADPCEDLFEYSCGGMQAQPSSSKAPHSTFAAIARKVEHDLKTIIHKLGKKRELDEVDSKVNNWYAACIDHKRRNDLGGAPLRTLIDSLGGWPAVDRHTWNQDAWDLERVVAGIHRNASIDALFSSGLVGNASNRKMPLQPGLFPAKLGLSNADFYVNFKRSKYSRKVLRAYFLLLFELAVETGATPDEQLKKETIQVIELEFNLAKAILLTKRGKALRTTLGALNIKSESLFNWKRYIGLLYENLNIPSFTDDDEVYLQHPNYVASVLGILNYYPKRVLANYLMSQVAMHYGGALSDRFRLAYMRFYHQLYGMTHFSKPSSLCVRSTNKHLGSALGYHFALNYFKDTTLKKAEELVHDLSKTYLDHMQHQVKWMDEITRASAVKKIKNMLEMVGYSKKINDKSYRVKVTKDMVVDPRNFFFNIVSDYALSTAFQLKELGVVRKRKGFDMSMTAQNAQYEPSQNKIVVAAGLLQEPIFHENYPRAVNLGGIGMATGHEITHGFDLTGALYDEIGNRRVWWTKATFQAFKRKAKCLLDEYNNFKVYGVHLRGGQTINENIADNGGLRIAYKAYMNSLKTKGKDQALPGKLLSKLTSKQLFFLSFAQVWCTKSTRASALHRIATDAHTLAAFRVRGTVRNMKEFAEAFNCPKGSKMNPVKKCIVW